ncbi:MAG TPA: helix-hairpin-helix domain-containing protein [Planctomycetia bacterium]|nr:helix-hairpin-helix domain-containing protein [Planctomycetia bacterium]
MKRARGSVRRAAGDASATSKARSPGSARRSLNRSLVRFEDIPNVGPATAGDFRLLGLSEPAQLAGRDPYALYDRLCAETGVRHDPCVIDVFIAAVRYMEGGPKRPWWAFTAERKRELVKRASKGG